MKSCLFFVVMRVSAVLCSKVIPLQFLEAHNRDFAGSKAGFVYTKHCPFLQASMGSIFQRDPRANLMLGGGERIQGQDVSWPARKLHQTSSC